MSIAPTGVLSTPVDTLRTMLSNSASFQNIVGVGSAAAALAYIGLHGFAGLPARPWAYVGLASHQSESYAGGSADYYKPSGALKIVIEFPCSRQSTLTAVTSTTIITDSSLIGAKDYYTGKQLQVLNGAASGGNPPTTALIQSFNNLTGQITLATPLSALPAIGNSYRIFAATPEQALVPFLNQLGDIQTELLALSGQSGYISIRKLGFSDWGRIRQDEDGTDYCGVNYVVDWGV